MNSFHYMPKSLKKAIRYIRQDVDSLDKLDTIEEKLLKTIQHKKQELNKR